MSWVEPPLWSTITLATLRISGKTPVVNERLIIRQRGTTIISATNFNNLIGTLAGPVLLMGRAVMISRISCSDIWAIIKSSCTRFFR